jgi:hypothetical protein
MKIKVDTSNTPKKQSRIDQFKEIIWENEYLDKREKGALNEYAYWLVSNSRFSAHHFRFMVEEFIELVPKDKRVSTIQSALAGGYRNITPPWFREEYIKEKKKPSFDNLAGKKKVEVGKILYDEVF